MFRQTNQGGSWVDSPVAKSERRRPLCMLLEGSQFGPLERAVPGQVVDVQPGEMP